MRPPTASTGGRRVHAELTLGRGIRVGDNTVTVLMRRAGLQGRTGHPRPRSIPQAATASDLVDRRFARGAPNERWVTDITEHATREGKLVCAVVLDVDARRVVGWSIDSSPTAAPATTALGMAVHTRTPTESTTIHSDHGLQCTAWAFTERAKASGLVPSMGSIGDCFDTAAIEAFSPARRSSCATRAGGRPASSSPTRSSNTLEIFSNRRRRHSSLDMRTPVEYEMINASRSPAA